jgi:glutathione S-transferase
MAAFGHGTYRPIGDEESLRLAAAAASTPGAAWRPAWPAAADDRLGRRVEIVPDDYGRDAVDGTVVAMTDRHVTIERAADRIGTVRVHFPRLGYEVVPV